MESGNLDKNLTAETGAIAEESKVERRSPSSCLLNPIICILAVCLACVTIGLLVVTAFHQHGQLLTDKMKSELERINSTCATNQCLKMATGLLTNMIPTANPCDDAYDFVCGGYESHKSLELKKSYRGVGNDLDEEIQRRMNEILLYHEDFGMQDKMQQQWKLSAATFYKTCLNNLDDENINNTNAILEIKEVIKSRNGFKNNIEEDSKNEDITLVNILANFWLNNNPVGFDIEWQKDFEAKTNTPYCINIASPVFFNTNESEIKDIHQTIFNFLQWNLSQNIIDEMATFHMDILLYFKEKTVVQKPKKKYIEFQMFSKQIDNITEHDGFLNLFFKHILKDSGETNAFTANNVCVRQPKKLKELLKFLKRTKPHVLIFYGIANEVLKIHQALPRFVGLNQLTRNKIKLNDAQIWSVRGKNVQSRCLSVMDDLFRFITARIYADANILPGTKADLRIIYQNVKESFILNVKESTFSEEAKKNIIKKIVAIEADISYPDWADDDAIMDSIYNNLRFSNHSYIENIFHALQYPNFAVVKKIASGDHSFSFFMESTISPTQTNAFYGAYYNRIAFAMGLLRPPLYSPEAPLASRYGFMGTVIGHEIGHAFDPTLHRLNVEESLKLQEKNLALVTVEMIGHTLWNENSTDEILYEEKYQCVVDEYGKEKIGTTNSFVNGKGASLNAIPDLAGIRAAYRAYKKLTAANIEIHPNLIGLASYTPEQLFFISSTQFFCSKFTNAALKEKFNNNSAYPPPRARANGLLKNTQEFATAFNCELGSKMNPHKKCILW